MGFLESFLKRFVNGETRKKLNELERNITKNVKDNMGEIKAKEENKNQIPRDYLHFPQFDGVIGDISEKKESMYERCTLDYYKATDEEINKYIELVQKEGYTKMTSVRYEKGNEYIIIENNGNSLHLVFHIKR